MVIAKRKRVPSAKIANGRLAKRMARRVASKQARAVEAKHRQAGGYGKALPRTGQASPWDIPPGGIKKSPAYFAVIRRHGGGKLPAPKNRAGAPVKGGYPLNKYPPNVIVDTKRDFWVPDEWAQAVKNTGRGGYYVGWMSPVGKFHFHRTGYPRLDVESQFGRPLTAKDGFNGTLRSLRLTLTEEGDRRFLRESLTPAERKHILPANKFHFGVISARRATSDKGIANMMAVEAHFRVGGVKPTWYVDEPSLKDYKNLGVDAVVGGKLCPARNKALNDAKKKGKVCVQISDDISKWAYVDCSKQNVRGGNGFDKANSAALGAKTYTITPVAAAQYLLAKIRSHPGKPKLAGVFPTANSALSIGLDEYSEQHFILGDFFVADSSPVRFDETMSLKEDYDFTCAHIKKHGCVLRCNRMLVHAKHSTNEGGAVSTRDQSGSKERYNINILQTKWPGVFRLNKRRPDEVVMNWKHYGKVPDEEVQQGKKRKASDMKASRQSKKKLKRR